MGRKFLLHMWQPSCYSFKNLVIKRNSNNMSIPHRSFSEKKVGLHVYMLSLYRGYGYGV